MPDICQAAFSNSKFYTRKWTKNTPKHSKKSLKSKIFAVFVFNLENFNTWQNIFFTRAPPIIRYALTFCSGLFSPIIEMCVKWDCTKLFLGNITNITNCRYDINESPDWFYDLYSAWQKTFNLTRTHKQKEITTFKVQHKKIWNKKKLQQGVFISITTSVMNFCCFYFWITAIFHF